MIAYSHQLEQKSRELEAATAELRAANERLQELDRLKDDFVSTVTHELRTPLTSIRAFSEILHDNPDVEPAQRQRFLGIIIKETERLTRLINQVLDLAKIESGTRRVARPPSRPERGRSRTRWPRRASCSRRSDVRARAASCRRACRRCCADRDRLMQVMLNLLSNAVKFCDRGHGPGRGRARRATPAALRVDVRDNGAGHRAAGPGGHLREIPPGRRHAHRQAAGHRPRPAHQPADRRALRRPDLGRERGRRRRAPASRSRCRSRATPAPSRAA